jgi:dGTPase
METENEVKQKLNQERWATLLLDRTFREKSIRQRFDGRNPFEGDYGRLISSSPIRRLQDKTQVFPLEQSDFIRTRLTHSLEVSYIASSIGLSIEKYLLDEKYLEEKYRGHISSLLRVAGLVHDLGNPPFGHFGEEAIRAFFKNYFQTSANKEGFENQEIQDLINFDGNVQTFRILRKLQFFKDEYSFNLTFPSLASIIKYPCNSINGNEGKNTKHIAFKKFGYFTSETDDYKEISNILKLNNKRHPITYLLEAADDIAFCAADIEDGVKLGLIDFEKIRSVFKKNLVENSSLLDDLDKLYNSFNSFENEKLFLTVQNFRVSTQGKMINAVIECFKKNYDSIMCGEFPEELILKSKAADIRKSYKDLQMIIFDSRKIMETEIAGWEVLYGLLEIFIPVCMSPYFKSTGNNKEARLYKLISSSFRYIFENFSNNENVSKPYKRVQLIVDFVAGMTDSYALNLYQKLKGIKL